MKTSFSHGKYDPLYLFYGDETFLMAELQDVLLAHALQPHERDFNLDIFYGPEVNAQQVLAACAGYPMMAERRVVIVREFEKLQDNRLFTAYAKRPNTNAVVVLVCGGKPNLNAHPFRALKSTATVCEFKRLESRRLPGWIEGRVRSAGREIEPRALQMLTDVCGGGLAAASAEVEKLLTFVGDRGTVTADDVIQASGHTREHNIFELQRMVGERRFESALVIAERLLQHSTNPRGEALRMLSVLGAFFSKLWKLSAARARGASEAEMAKAADVKGYFLKEYLHALRNWGGDRLDRAFSALLAADFELKGGSSRSDQLVVLLMLHRMIGESAVRRAA
ncbi:MAG TPA: DNA polymerase III subunit delta [Rhodothermales bacterium]